MTYAKTAALAATLLASGFAATAADAAQVSTDAKVKIVKPITLTKNKDLDFGAVVVNGAGTVTVSAADTAATCSANLTCAKAANAAQFTVTGSNNETLSVSYPATVNLNGPGAAMVATLDVRPASPALSSTGSYSFAVGGSLAVAAGQVEGSYSGNFNVTVNYN